MYCQLLDEAVQTLKYGKPRPEAPEPVIDIAVEAYIDGGYLADAMHKIEIYQRVAAIRTEEQISRLTEDLTDRFGALTPPVRRLLAVARIKNYARNLGIRSIVEKPAGVEVSLGEDHQVTPERLIAAKECFGGQLQFFPALRRQAEQGETTDFLQRFFTVLAGEAAHEESLAAGKEKD